jgi:restriction system protein
MEERMSKFWMIRAGEGGRLADDYRKSTVVAMTYAGNDDFSGSPSRESVRRAIEAAYPNAKPGAIANGTANLYKFVTVAKPGDTVMSYDPIRRTYLVGQIVGDYAYRPGLVPGHDHIRDVKWTGEVSRDDLSQAARNTLGATNAIFEPGEQVLAEIQQKLSGRTAPSLRVERNEAAEDTPSELDEIRRDVIGRAHEFIKDKISELDWDEMQELVAGILRAMGYKTQVSPQGPDRGKDIVASPDGLGFSSPRIKVEVKHRTRTPMGAPEVRGFIGGLRGEDRGLYVSTGGFTKEAEYEAERASVPVHLLDLDALATLLTQHYERMDNEGRALVPLVQVYWPASS